MGSILRAMAASVINFGRVATGDTSNVAASVATRSSRSAAVYHIRGAPKTNTTDLITDAPYSLKMLPIGTGAAAGDTSSVTEGPRRLSLPRSSPTLILKCGKPTPYRAGDPARLRRPDRARRENSSAEDRRPAVQETQHGSAARDPARRENALPCRRPSTAPPPRIQPGAKTQLRSMCGNRRRSGQRCSSCTPPRVPCSATWALSRSRCAARSPCRAAWATTGRQRTPESRSSRRWEVA